VNRHYWLFTVHLFTHFFINTLSLAVEGHNRRDGSRRSARTSTTATKTPPLKDITADISRYAMAEFTPKSTAPPILATDHIPPPPRVFPCSRGASICASGFPDETSLRRMRRSSKYW